MIIGFKKWAVYGVFTLIALICLSAAFLVVSILYGMAWSDIIPPPLLGNRPEVISRLTEGQSEAQPFSFLIIGDIGSSTIFEEFYQNTSLVTAPDFGVILGDFVANPELNRHRFFMGEFGEWNMTFPVFLIAGNHDVVTNHTRNVDRLHDPFSLQDFEKLYGPTNFSFIYRGCLFIGLNDAYRIDYLDYLKEVLSRRPPETRMTFVFMHIPPPSISPLITTRELTGEKEFMQLMNIYDVDYVFTGDFHSYFRTDNGRTKYIISGGGGSALHGESGRSFHHALLMTVDPSKKKVDEIIYALKPTLDPIDHIENDMICRIYPLFEKKPLAWVGVFSLVAVVMGGLIVFLITRIAVKRRVSHRPGGAAGDGKQHS